MHVFSCVRQGSVAGYGLKRVSWVGGCERFV